MTTSRRTDSHEMDVNAVASYNLRVIRQRRGITQDDVAHALARLTGHRLPQASISAMERGFDGERRRRFDAHELYLLAVVLGVPIVYFFLPPTGEPRHLADTGRPTRDLYAAALGREHQLTDMDDRLAGLDPVQAVDVVADLDGNTRPTTWREDYRRWRNERLRQITRNCDGLDEAARALGTFFDQVRRAGVRSFVTNAMEDR